MVCSECSEVGHKWIECKNPTKRCLNCEGNHRTTAPQCPKRKQEANKIRQQTTTRHTNDGISYSAAVKSNTPNLQNLNIPNDIKNNK